MKASYDIFLWETAQSEVTLQLYQSEDSQFFLGRHCHYIIMVIIIIKEGKIVRMSLSIHWYLVMALFFFNLPCCSLCLPHLQRHLRLEEEEAIQAPFPSVLVL